MNTPVLALGFRQARQADLDRLMAVEQAAHPFPWTRRQLADCLEAGYGCWLACLDDAAREDGTEGEVILGYAVVVCVLDEASLLNLCVAPQWQGRGVGGALLDYLIRRSWEPPLRRWFLEVRASNERAIALYLSRGFRQIGWRKAYYPAAEGKEDALVLALEVEGRQGDRRLDEA